MFCWLVYEFRGLCSDAVTISTYGELNGRLLMNDGLVRIVTVLSQPN